MALQPLDLVTVDVIGAHLLAVAREMGIVLVRSSYSSNVKERQDCSASILDGQGLTIAQAEHIPLHMGSMLGIAEHILRKFTLANIHPGDLFLANDPYSGGGTHLPDITLAAPFFYDGQLVAFVSNIAHHAEVGGALRGATDIHSEGLRIPPVKVCDAGRWRQDVLDLLLLNFRLPQERQGDLRAQFAAGRVGLQRLGELYARYGGDTVATAIKTLRLKASRQIRQAISLVPDGTYAFTDWMDADDGGREAIAVIVTVADDVLTLDFTSCAAQSAGTHNVTFPALKATVLYAVRALLDPSLPANAGFYDAVRIVAPPGSIVNAIPPAAVNNRSDTCQRIVDAIFGALAPALPSRVPAAGNGAVTGILFSGYDPYRRRFFSYIETLGGGSGARPTKDGLDGVHVHVTNTSNLPVEALETEYPLRVEKYELVAGSGGAGEFRGGLGFRRQIRILADQINYRSKGDRVFTPPWGLAGGEAGGTASFILNPGTLAARPLGPRMQGVILGRDDVIAVTTPGAGGFGDPARRAASALERDRREGKVGADGRLEEELQSVAA